MGTSSDAKPRPQRRRPFRSSLWAVAAVLLVIAFLGVIGGTPLSYFIAAAAAFLLAVGVREHLRRREVITNFRRTYAVAGKDLLLVYSDSPHWKEYIETTWMPRWSDRMVILNRSKPWSEERVEVKLWRQEAGDLEHTPVVILVPPRGSTTIVRFWLAFRDYKHGKDSRLRDAEQRLREVIGEHPVSPALGTPAHPSTPE